ncbi:MAG: phage integrase N-terminal SAM-like domain-containing protein [Anditalea sp.]
MSELKEYLFHRVEVRKLSASSVNQTISAFKILFKDVLGRTWDPVRVKRPRRPKPLPRFFQAPTSGQSRSLWSTNPSKRLRFTFM